MLHGFNIVAQSLVEGDNMGGKRNGYAPSEYAAQAFDTAILINSAVIATKGDVSSTKAFGEALKQAKFESVRGSFKFNRNQMPIQNYFLRETVKAKP
jgi:branched-chain amino acid transport system substrate-binding protein